MKKGAGLGKSDRKRSEEKGPERNLADCGATKGRFGSGVVRETLGDDVV